MVMVEVQDESPEAELRRMVYAGAIWFAAVLLAGAVSFSGVLASGWRPSELAPAAGAVWWIGATAWFGALACFGWSGCPTLGFPLRAAVKQKQVCSRAGVVLSIVAAVGTSLPLLLG